MLPPVGAERKLEAKAPGDDLTLSNRAQGSVMDQFWSLEKRLQQLDEQIRSLTATSAVASSKLAQKLDDLASRMAMLGFEAVEGEVQKLSGEGALGLQPAATPKGVAPAAAPACVAACLPPSPSQPPPNPQQGADQTETLLPLPDGDKLTIDAPQCQLTQDGWVEEIVGENSEAEQTEQGQEEYVPENAQLEKQGSQTSRRSSQILKNSALAALQGKDDRSSLVKAIGHITEVVACITIFLNMMLMVIQLQYEGHAMGVELGISIPGVWPNLDVMFIVLEHIFNAIFIIELGFRLITLKCKFFYNNGVVMKFNVFDVCLILSTSIDLYISQQLEQSEGINLATLRSFRFFRVTRALRALDALKFFLPLRLLLSVVASSFAALFWSTTLLILSMLTAAIFLCQSVLGVLQDHQRCSPETREWLFEHYGTSSRSAWTVFQFTFSGSWPNYARPLVDDVNNAFAAFFFFYIICVTFALFRIVTALFLKDTMAQAAKDAELAVQQQMQQKKQFANHLLEFFTAADTSGDGLLTEKEFRSILKNEKVVTWLSMMDISIHETQEIFEILAGGDGVVSFQEFTRGICQMKGSARSEDVMALKRDGQKLTRVTMAEFREVHNELKTIGEAQKKLQLQMNLANSMAAKRKGPVSRA